MSRTLAREDAFKLIFEMIVSENEAEDVISYLCETVDKENDMWAQKNISKENLEYIKGVVHGVKDNISQIDDLIKPKLNKWTMDRISKINLAILRLSVYEIVFNESIPDKVAVNEAVELTKKYGGEESRSFINGVLGNIINDKNKEG